MKKFLSHATRLGNGTSVHGNAALSGQRFEMDCPNSFIDERQKTSWKRAFADEAIRSEFGFRAAVITSVKPVKSFGGEISGSRAAGLWFGLQAIPMAV